MALIAQTSTNLMSSTGYFSATENFSSAERQITVENLSNTGKQQL